MSLQLRALMGDDFAIRSEVGYWLAQCRQTRALRSWLAPGCYAWRRLDDAKFVVDADK